MHAPLIQEESLCHTHIILFHFSVLDCQRDENLSLLFLFTATGISSGRESRDSSYLPFPRDSYDSLWIH